MNVVEYFNLIRYDGGEDELFLGWFIDLRLVKVIWIFFDELVSWVL